MNIVNFKVELEIDRESTWKAYQAVRDKEQDLLNGLIDLLRVST